MERLKAALRRWWRKQLEEYALAGLIAERREQYASRLERLEASGASTFEVERSRRRYELHLAEMEKAQDGYGHWPADEQASVERIRARYC